MLEVVIAVFKQFVWLFWTVLPYFLVGAVTGALMEAYVGAKLAARFFNRGTVSVVAAAVLGAILPGCSCATMPMAEGLKRSGARLGTIAAFIMVSPLLSPHTAILNWAMLGWQFTLARIVFALGGGIALGLLVNRIETGAAPAVACSEPACDCCGDKAEGERPRFLAALWDIVKELSKYFLLGLFIAALLTTLVPEESIPRFIGESGPLAYGVAVVAGIPLYVCEGEEIPITKALLDLGLGAGPAFAFLLGSVGTCIPTMIMAQRTLGRRVVLVYILIWPVFAVASGLLFGLLYRG